MSYPLQETYIAWTSPWSKLATRGECRLFSDGVSQADLQRYAHIAGRQDKRAWHPNPDTRRAYVMGVAFIMSQVDGLDLATVHALLLSIREYQEGCAEEVLTEGSAR